MNFQATQVTFHYDLSGVDATCTSDGPTEGVDNSCGIHFHAGTSCETDEDVGGHYYSSAEDPWVTEAFYDAEIGSVVVEYGYTYAETLGHVLVLHDVDGTRITCDVVQ